jgi:hypothetical protein
MTMSFSPQLMQVPTRNCSFLTPKTKNKLKSQTIPCLPMSQLNSQGFNVHTIVTSNKISPSQKPKNLRCQLQIGVGENFIVEKVPLVTTLGAFIFLSSLKTFDIISIIKVHLLSEVFHTPSCLSMPQ